MEHTQPKRNTAVIGTLILVLGLVLLVGQVFSFNFSNIFQFWNIPYPIYIIAFGIVFVVIGLLGHQNWVGFTIAGSIIGVTGAMLAFQDATHSYQTWAYLWALVFPGSIGLALLLQGFFTKQERQVKVGLRILGIALVLMLVGWSFFEGALDLSGYHLDRLTNFAGPILLMAIGAWLMLRRANSEE